MQVTRNEMAWLVDIDENIGIALDLMRHRTQAHLSNDVALRYAVHHAVLIIAEAVRHLPPSVTARYPEIAWRDIASTGDLLCYEYFRVDPDVMWGIIREHLPPLQKAVRKMIQEFKQASLA